ncbi:MAG: hypothetical protein NZO16_04800, partial [Deltaproteobacteria bacterium]|nr:hypothetical protein [Deltaproteobacteria bacterium]
DTCYADENCQRGSDCEFGFDERGNFVGRCIWGGSSGFDCRDDSDCKFPEFRCTSEGKCELNGNTLGLPCRVDRDCEKKYCMVDNEGKERCVSAYTPGVSPVKPCEEDKDCEGFSKKKCLEERDEQTGEITVKCSEKGIGEYCLSDADCSKLSKRCAVAEDGSFKCIRGGPSLGALCNTDADCKKYEKVCKPVDGGLKCIKNDFPAVFDFPCNSDAQCKSKICRENRCVESNTIRQSECRTDQDCQYRRRVCVRSRCKEVPGYAPNQCERDDDCGHNVCAPSGDCLRFIGAGVSECMTREDCERKRNPGQSDIDDGVSTNFSRGSLQFLKESRDFETHAKLQALLEYVKANNLPLFIDFKNSNRTLITFNDISCGMSKKLVANTLQEKHRNRAKFDVLLIPVIVGGDKADNISNLNEYLCYLEVSKPSKNSLYSAVRGIFDSDSKTGSIGPVTRQKLSPETTKLEQFNTCIASKKYATEASVLSTYIDELGIDGTPTSYVVTKEKHSEYSGYRKNGFWENIPIF